MSEKMSDDERVQLHAKQSMELKPIEEACLMQAQLAIRSSFSLNPDSLNPEPNYRYASKERRVQEDGAYSALVTKVVLDKYADCVSAPIAPMAEKPGNESGSKLER